jgi:uncharacterized protein (TIGR02466 family)
MDKKMKAELIKIFPEPIMLTKYEADFSEELRFVQNIEYVENTGNGNFTSKDNYLLKHPELAKLKKFIDEALDNFTTHILHSTQKLRTTQSWTSRNPPGSFHHDHMHPNSIFSCCFYFVQNKDHPPIVYFNRASNRLLLHYTVDGLNADINAGTYVLPCEAGQMVIFPSHLWHKVPINQGKGDRLSFSINTFAKSELGDMDNLTHLNVKDEN